MRRSYFLTHWEALFRLTTAFDGGTQRFNNYFRTCRVLVVGGMACFVLFKLLSTVQYNLILNQIHDFAYYANYLSVEVVLWWNRRDIAEVTRFIVDQTYSNPSMR